MKLHHITELQEAVKLSFTSKLDKRIPSWSLQAGTTCPGSVCPKTKQIKPSCATCYAKKGTYNYPNPKKARDENRKDWKRAGWVDDMVEIMGDYGRFRWFDSGDIYTAKLAEKIYEVMKKTPHVTHWLPTMSHNVPRITKWVDKMDKLKNVVVRRSSGEITGEFEKHHGSTIVDKPTAEKWMKGDRPKGVELCPVGATKGRKNCDGCRKCFDKNTQTIAYIKH